MESRDPSLREAPLQTPASDEERQQGQYRWFVSADEAASNPIAPPDGVPAERVDALYGLPLDEFTTGRDELAKDLRQAGRRQAAAWVKGLRKPTAAAWLVNQLARTQRKQTRTLIDAAERLREAHERLLSGRADPDDLRAAAERQNDAVRDLVRRASGLLDRDGKSPSRSSLDKVAETLQAVAADDETREAFAVGRLTREARASGFGGLGVAMAAGPSAEPAARRGRVRPSREPKAMRTEDRARARATLKEAKAEHRERRRDVVSAERAVERARREAQRAQRRLEEVTRALEQARAQEADAAARVADAERELKPGS